MSRNDAITSRKVKCMCLSYHYLKKKSFCIFDYVVEIIMHVLLTSFPLCRDGSRDEILWERLGWYIEGLRGP